MIYTAAANESMVMHDMRNLLTLIQLQISRLEQSHEKNAAPIFEKLYRSLERASNFANSKIVHENPKAQISSKPIKLTHIIQEIKNSIPQFTSGEQEFVSHVSDDIMVFGDSTYIFRAVFNIAYNAVTAMQGIEGSQLKFSATIVGNEVSIAIMDNGPGMPKVVIDSLYPNLSRKLEVSKRLGMGISISTYLCKQMGGHLDLAKSDCSGTTFIMTLPGSYNYSDKL